MAYRIDTIPSRGHPPTILLHRHWHEGKRVRKETIANLTRHPPWLVEGIRAVVRAKSFLPHGHTAAILGTLKDLGFKRSLANRRLAGEALILYDLSSSYVEGRGSALAAFGHSRDGRRDRKRIEFGLLCDREGCPVAPAQPSPSARSKAASKRTRDKTAVHSLHTLLADLSTVALNEVALGSSGTVPAVTTPTPGQRRAFELLGVDLAKMFPDAGR